MSIVVNNPGLPAQLPPSGRRAELEAQLGLAIRRAQKRYMQQQPQAPQPGAGPANPPHLGTRIDIRA